MRALVVDDSTAIRSYLRKILSKQGFDVIEASNGREGLERLFATQPIDLVLLDWNMPEMNGMEMLERMRTAPDLSGVCVMMVTTDTNMWEIAHALYVGANEYVMKPFTPDVITEKLQLLGFPVATA